MKPLKTLKGSRIWYSKFGVGKQVGSKIYFHKSVWDKIVPKNVWNKAVEILERKRSLQTIQTVYYDLNVPHIVRFDSCPGFNTQREPMVGNMMFVDVNQNEITKEAYNRQIYHHKWLWVEPNYTGFDAKVSYEWSRLWLSKLYGTASGYVHIWEEQLKKYNII
jgi:hypothetical protein